MKNIPEIDSELGFILESIFLENLDPKWISDSSQIEHTWFNKNSLTNSYQNTLEVTPDKK